MSVMDSDYAFISLIRGDSSKQCTLLCSTIGTIIPWYERTIKRKIVRRYIDDAQPIDEKRMTEYDAYYAIESKKALEPLGNFHIMRYDIMLTKDSSIVIGIGDIDVKMSSGCYVQSEELIYLIKRCLSMCMLGANTRMVYDHYSHKPITSEAVSAMHSIIEKEVFNIASTTQDYGPLTLLFMLSELDNNLGRMAQYIVASISTKNDNDAELVRLHRSLGAPVPVSKPSSQSIRTLVRYLSSYCTRNRLSRISHCCMAFIALLREWIDLIDTNRSQSGTTKW